MKCAGGANFLAGNAPTTRLPAPVPAWGELHLEGFLVCVHASLSFLSAAKKCQDASTEAVTELAMQFGRIKPGERCKSLNLLLQPLRPYMLARIFD